MVESSTLRPGLLVGLKTSITGNVKYFKQTLEEEHEIEGGAQKARWETERLITDPAEHEAARKVRSKASNMIAGVCSYSSFGLLCPEANTEMLDKAVQDARALAEEFNATAKLSRVSIFVITGRIAPDDVEAVKAINSEVRGLMEAMQEGIANLDVKKVRDAANRARDIGNMLSPEAEARVKIAIDTARAAARKIVAAGEAGAIEFDRIAIRKITDMWTAFLDCGPVADVQAPAAEGAAVDFDPIAPIAPPAAAAATIEME